MSHVVQAVALNHTLVSVFHSTFTVCQRNSFAPRVEFEPTALFLKVQTPQPPATEVQANGVAQSNPRRVFHRSFHTPELWLR